MKKVKKKQNLLILNKIIFKNFKSNWKNYLLFFMSVVLSVTLLFSTFAIKDMLGNFHSSERIYMGEGLFGILKNTLIIMTVLTLIMMVFSTKYYIKTRISDYVLYIILGIQKKTMMIFIIGEYVISVLVALLVGLLCGNAVCIIFRMVFNKFNNQLSISNSPGATTIIMTLIVCFLLFIVNAAFNYDTFYYDELSKAMSGGVAKESMPIKKLTPLALVGIVIVCVSCVLYQNRIFAESMKIIIVFLGGVYLILLFGGTFVVNKLRKQETFYYHNLIPLNNFYYKFQNNMNHIFVLFVFHFLVLFSFSSQIILNIPKTESKELYPYDYVSIIFDDEIKEFQELQSKFGGEIKNYPIIRLTVPGGNEEYSGGMSITPQGQHIGISESTYQDLCGKRLGLKDREIHLIYQQDCSDTAHPLDWGAISKNPSLHLGPSLDYLWYERSELFSDHYSVTGEERNNLIGYLVNGMQENLVVFSDAYFKQARTSAEGPTQMVLMNIPKNNQKEAAKLLQQFGDHQKMKRISVDYREDYHIKPVYQKEQMLQDTSSERVLRLTFNIFIAIALICCELFVFYIKIASDFPYLKKKMEFLKYMGMKKRERSKNLKEELWSLALVPIGIALISSIGFTYFMMHLRWFNHKEMIFYIQNMSIIVGIYLIIQIVIVSLIGYYIFSKVDK
ncbi:MAG: FtsX-like permease family protein [Lachnospiraceae bacterium]